MSTSTYFSIGSCRIARPLRKLQQAGKATLTNWKDPIWFTHTSAGALEFAKIVSGEILPPPTELQPFIFETTPQGRDIVFDGSAQLQAADWIVVEISSMLLLRHDGWTLNQHMMRKHRDKADFQIKPRNQTFAELESDIRGIRDLLDKPMLLVDHIHVEVNGAPIPQRLRITDCLKNIAAHLDCRFLSTRSFLDGPYAEGALEDSNHYAKDFEIKVGEIILSETRETVA